MFAKIKNALLAPDREKKGLMPIEWLTVGYVSFTSILMLIFGSRMSDIGGMIVLRAAALASVGIGFLCYKRMPSHFTIMLRVLFQLSLLAFWYPDLYEISRIFPNADHVFAGLEQQVFGCQPALLFSEVCTSKILSELFYMGYFFYFPMIAMVLVYYLFARYEDFEKAATIVLCSFFLYYLVFLFLPVAGPQYYFNAIGLDAAYSGDFQPVGHWFNDSIEMLDPPGWKEGLFYKLLSIVRESERPVASFPSSHVGVSLIVVILALRTRSKGLLAVLLPLWIFLVCATIFIRAHYVVDVIAGFLTAPVLYLILNRAWR